MSLASLAVEIGSIGSAPGGSGRLVELEIGRADEAIELDEVIVFENAVKTGIEAALEIGETAAPEAEVTGKAESDSLPAATPVY
jgi:hypothetical protein